MVFLTSKGRSQFEVHSAAAGRLGEERTTKEGKMDGHRRQTRRGGVLHFGGPAQACACSPSRVYGLGRGPGENGVYCDNGLCAWASFAQFVSEWTSYPSFFSGSIKKKENLSYSSELSL